MRTLGVNGPANLHSPLANPRQPSTPHHRSVFPSRTRPSILDRAMPNDSTHQPLLTPTAYRRRRRNRRLLFAAIALCLLAIFTAFAARLWLRHAIAEGSAQLDGTLHVRGLTAPVTVRRDTYGIPHIQASTEDDLLLAQGYVTAQDRLWQMDMLRRHAAGELAEVLGSSMLDHDRTQRYLQLRAVADRSVDQLDPAQRHALN